LKYDYLIVGSGLFGSVFAHEVTKHGAKCLVIDKRKATGGNIRCEKIEGINCHMYGPHIFHTNDEDIWNYVNRLAKFQQYVYSPMANYYGQLYNLPFNMNTFYQLWGTFTPEEAMRRIQEESSIVETVHNLEDQAIKLVGYEIYEKLIKSYTEKQWGRSCRDLPSSIIKRLTVRFTFDNNYFTDRFQGMPVHGYNELTDNLLAGIEVKTGVDYFEARDFFNSVADRVVYTGPLDRFHDFRFGELEYRSLEFRNEILPMQNFQGCAVINHTGRDKPYTRTIEHKHFTRATGPGTVITYEHPTKWTRDREPYYPINDERNGRILRMYEDLQNEGKVIFGGRLAEYRYYDMHQVIASALKKSRECIKEKAALVRDGS